MERYTEDEIETGPYGKHVRVVACVASRCLVVSVVSD
jgi:hypothetical protein